MDGRAPRPDCWERYPQLLRGWQHTLQLQRHDNHSGDERSSRLPPLVPTPRAVLGRQHMGAIALGGVGKAQTIWWMGFSACHLPCAASKLCVVPRSPLSCAPQTPTGLSFIQALTWIFFCPI